MKEDVKHVAAPVVIVPYVWIGDFVRCHSVVKLLRAKNPDRPIDIVSSTLCAPSAVRRSASTQPADPAPTIT